MHSPSLLSFAVPSAIMAGMVLILGAIVPASPLPELPLDRAAVAPFVNLGTCLEAPTIPFAATGTSGRATICDDGHDLRVSLEVSGLVPGAEYTAWFGYGTAPRECHEALCRLIDRPGDDPTASLHRIDDASAQLSGVLELERELVDVRLVHGAQVTLQLLGERGRAGPYVQSTFIVP